jgi:hypothetical protein
MPRLVSEGCVVSLPSSRLTATQAAEDRIEWQLFSHNRFLLDLKIGEVCPLALLPPRSSCYARSRTTAVHRSGERVMNDLLLNYAQGLAEYQVLISACLIVFVFFAIGRDISRSLGRVEDELSKIVAAMKQMRRD